eukprot:768408-Hanusia_phi.AAC.9
MVMVLLLQSAHNSHEREGEGWKRTGGWRQKLATTTRQGGDPGRAVDDIKRARASSISMSSFILILPCTSPSIEGLAVSAGVPIVGEHGEVGAELLVARWLQLKNKLPSTSPPESFSNPQTWCCKQQVSINKDQYSAHLASSTSLLPPHHFVIRHCYSENFSVFHQILGVSSVLFFQHLTTYINSTATCPSCPRIISRNSFSLIAFLYSTCNNLT